MTFICEFCQRAIENENDIRAAGPTSDEGFACRECYERGERKPHNGHLWESQAFPNETVSDAATRFVLEMFGVGRRIVWGSKPGEFRFIDGYWCYLIVFNGGHWQVQRTDQMTPKAKARAKARRRSNHAPRP